MICIVTAMENEIKTFIKKFQPNILEEKPFKIFKKDNIIILISGIGLVNASCALTYTLTKFKNITSILNIGTCGSISKKINSLNKVRVTKSFYATANATAFGYSYGQIPKMPKYFEQIITNFNNYKSCSEFKPISIASTDIFVNSVQQKEMFIDKISEEIDAVDMECTSIFQTAYIFNLPVIALKIISDSIYFPNSHEQFKNIMSECGRIISTTLFKIIEEIKKI